MCDINTMKKVCVVINGEFLDFDPPDIVGVFSSKEEAIEYIKKHYPSPWSIEPDNIRSPWDFKEVYFNRIDDEHNYIIT